MSADLTISPFFLCLSVFLPDKKGQVATERRELLSCQHSLRGNTVMRGLPRLPSSPSLPYPMSLFDFSLSVHKS